MGLFTLKPIPQNTYTCAYAPTASMRAASNQGDDYVIDVSLGEKVVAVNGPQNPYEAGLGIMVHSLSPLYLQSFPSLWLAGSIVSFQTGGGSLD